MRFQPLHIRVFHRYDRSSNYMFSELNRLIVHHSNGSLIPAEANYSRSRSEEGVLYIVILRDIRQQLEHKQTLTIARVAVEGAKKNEE